MECSLSDRQCTPCKGGTPPLKGADLEKLAKELTGDWKIADEHHLERAFTFKNFRDALAFTNKVGELAEAQGHHPDITLAWGKVALKVWTHKINGLSESDFIFAAKVDKLMNP